uniref:Uncharacterized protein n=1 Tax=Cyanistes caeruleus TaxID=156563 RepID=A0A8C0Z7H5_CYACU
MEQQISQRQLPYPSEPVGAAGWASPASPGAARGATSASVLGSPFLAFPSWKFSLCFSLGFPFPGISQLEILPLLQSWLHFGVEKAGADAQGLVHSLLSPPCRT